MTPSFLIRPMLQADIPAVSALAAEIHLDFPEDDPVIAQKHGLYPCGCRMLDVAGQPAGYILSHPWRRYAPPALNSLMDPPPLDADVYYIHDLALSVRARGLGAASGLLTCVMDWARAQEFKRMALVAVGGSEGFWRHMGFQAVETDAVTAYLRSYGDGAYYMERLLG